MIKATGASSSSRRAGRTVAVLAIAITVIVLDQVTKTLAVNHLSDGPVHFIGPISFALGFNTGVAFSLGTGLGLPIVIIVATVVAMLFFFARVVPSYPAAISLGLVVGGSFGNLSDRIFRGRGGAVVDFIHTSFWPTFNLADAAIVCGCFGLAVVFWHRAGETEPNFQHVNDDETSDQL